MSSRRPPPLLPLLLLLLLQAGSSTPPNFATRDVPCWFLTNRWPLNAASILPGNASVLDSVGSWDGVAHGERGERGVSFSEGSAIFSSGGISLGVHSFGGTMSVAFWAKQLFPVRGPLPVAYFFSFNSQGSGNTPGALYFASTGPANQSYFLMAGADRAGTEGWGGTYPAINVWTHLAVTLSANGYLCVYVNGTKVQCGINEQGAPPVASRELQLGIGARPDAQIELADFQLARGYALSATDAANLFAGRSCYEQPTNSSRTRRRRRLIEPSPTQRTAGVALANPIATSLPPP